MIVIRRSRTGEPRRLNMPITEAEATALIAEGLIEAAFPTLDEVDSSERPAKPRAPEPTGLAA